MSNLPEEFKIDEPVVVQSTLSLMPDHHIYNDQINYEIKKTYDKVAEIPFGNSDVQWKLGVISAELGAGRGYRAAAINLASEFGKLNKAIFNLRRMFLDIKELNLKLDQNIEAQDKAWFGAGNAQRQIEYERIQIDIEEKKAGLPELKKLIADTVRNINILKPIVDKQDMTRDEFERLELDTFRTKMVNQLNGVGDQILLLGNMERAEIGDDLYSKLCDNSYAKLLSPHVYNERILGSGSGRKLLIEADTNQAIDKEVERYVPLLPKPFELPKAQPGTLPAPNLFDNTK